MLNPDLEAVKAAKEKLLQCIDIIFAHTTAATEKLEGQLKSEIEDRQHLEELVFELQTRNDDLVQRVAGLTAENKRLQAPPVPQFAKPLE